MELRKISLYAGYFFMAMAVLLFFIYPRNMVIGFIAIALSFLAFVLSGTNRQN